MMPHIETRSKYYDKCIDKKKSKEILTGKLTRNTLNLKINGSFFFFLPYIYLN